MNPPTETPKPAVPARQRLAVRIWVGIGALFAVLALAVTLCVGALLSAYDALKHLSELASAERHAVAIGFAAREQYMHQAHGVLQRDPRHLGHERHWGAMLATHVKSLSPMVGEAEARQLDSIGAESAALSKVFSEEIYPAALADDVATVRSAHAVAERRLAAMVGASDASIAQLSIRTKEASSYATARVRRAGLLAVLTTVLAGIIALRLAQGFARQIVQPVTALDSAAARIGEGDFAAKVPSADAFEFDRLGDRLRQVAQQLREREERLLEAERLATVGALAAGVAHELNNPLGVMLGYLKRLQKQTLPEAVAEELHIVDQEAHQCRRIVEDLVTLAREPRLERAEIDLAGLVRDTCKRLETVPEVEGRTLRVLADDPIEIDVDPTRIAQVVRNLVLNAAAASSPTEPIEVEVTREGDPDSGARIVVRDRGAGIEPADLPHVFEPFYSRRSGGTGLGLAVSRGIVRTHGGTIAIESARGAGTSVTVRLPLRAQRPA